jgi:hypothetical protein
VDYPAGLAAGALLRLQRHRRTAPG